LPAESAAACCPAADTAKQGKVQLQAGRWEQTLPAAPGQHCHCRPAAAAGQHQLLRRRLQLWWPANCHSNYASSAATCCLLLLPGKGQGQPATWRLVRRRTQTRQVANVASSGCCSRRGSISGWSMATALIRCSRVLLLLLPPRRACANICLAGDSCAHPVASGRHCRPAAAPVATEAGLAGGQTLQRHCAQACWAACMLPAALGMPHGPGAAAGSCCQTSSLARCACGAA
jgi:hypothetical protein